MSERAVATRRQQDDDDDEMTTALALPPVLALAYDAAALTRGVDPEIAASWVYDFNAGGGDGTVKGIGGAGAAEGVRLLAAKGEIIRVVECVLVRDDDEEALFQATAKRFVINPETMQEIELDTLTRGKRQPKKQARRDGSLVFDKDWYSKGITKATRNVVLAMTPGNVKTAILRAGLAAKGSLPAPQQSQQQQRRPQPQTPARQAAAAIAGPTATQEQLASIRDWHDQINERHRGSVGPVSGWFALAFPGAARVADLLVDQADRYIRMLRHVAISKDGAVPADGADPEHEADESGAKCGVCGLQLAADEPEQPGLPT